MHTSYSYHNKAVQRPPARASQCSACGGARHRDAENSTVLNVTRPSYIFFKILGSDLTQNGRTHIRMVGMELLPPPPFAHYRSTVCVTQAPASPSPTKEAAPFPTPRRQEKLQTTLPHQHLLILRAAAGGDTVLYPLQWSPHKDPIPDTPTTNLRCSHINQHARSCTPSSISPLITPTTHILFVHEDHIPNTPATPL